MYKQNKCCVKIHLFNDVDMLTFAEIIFEHYYVKIQRVAFGTMFCPLSALFFKYYSLDSLVPDQL